MVCLALLYGVTRRDGLMECGCETGVINRKLPHVLNPSDDKKMQRII